MFEKKAVIVDGNEFRAISCLYTVKTGEKMKYFGEVIALPRRSVIKILEDGKKHNVVFYENPLNNVHKAYDFGKVNLKVSRIDTYNEDLEKYPLIFISFESEKMTEKNINSLSEVLINKLAPGDVQLKYRECMDFVQKYK